MPHPVLGIDLESGELSTGLTDDRLMSRRRALALLGASALVPLQACSGPSSPPVAAVLRGGEALHYMGLQEVARLIASRDVSPVELTQHMLDRISKVDVTLKSYATVMAEPALAAARSAEQEILAGKYRGPLHGVPIAVKDLCYTKGIRTMGGTAVLKGFVPDVDATVVSRLHDAGAILLGKLNLTEGAALGYHPDFDVPLNPWDRGRWPGGSSSGPGVATAAGLCFGALGTDTGGSIRFPSSANGVVGLKPTYGRVSRFGVLPLAESLDHVGPMARRVADVAILFDAIAGVDPRDPTSLRESAPNSYRDIGQGIEGLRIGLDREYAFAGVDTGQVASIEEALKVLTGLGARGELPLARTGVWSLFPCPLTTRSGPYRHPAGRCTKGAGRVHETADRRPRRGGCHRVPEWRSADVPHYPGDTVWLPGGVSGGPGRGLGGQ